MSLNNMEEFEISVPDVQSREMQILEENDAHVQQNFSTSTCSMFNKGATGKYTPWSEYHIQILFYWKEKQKNMY